MNKNFFRALAASLAFGVITGCASVGGGQRVTRVSDPARGFSFSVSPELTPQEARDGFYHYRLEARGIDVYVEAVPAGTEEEGVGETLRSAGVDPASLVLDGSTAFGDWRARRLIDRGRDRAVAVAYQMRGGVVYSLIVAASASAMPGDPPGSVMGILGSFRFSEAGGAAAAATTREELEALVRDAAESGGGSISLAAIRDGRIIYRYSAGMARRGEPGSPETAYHWGSMTKVVTAVAVMQLEERGLVGLDSPIARYLPEFPTRFGITVRNLLNHSSGLPEREVTHLVSYRGQRSARPGGRSLRLPGARGPAGLQARHGVRILQLELPDPGSPDRARHRQALCVLGCRDRPAAVRDGAHLVPVRRSAAGDPTGQPRYPGSRRVGPARRVEREPPGAGR